MRYAVAVTCQGCATGVLAVLACRPGPQRKRFSFLSCCYSSTCGVFCRCCWASGCVSEATLALGGAFSCLSDTSIREVRVGMNLAASFCLVKLQVHARILGCLSAASLAGSPRAEDFHSRKTCPLYMDCISTPPPSSPIFLCSLI